MDLVHLPEKQLAEWTFSRKTLTRIDICPNEHTIARMYEQLSEWTLARMTNCSEWTLAPTEICPNEHFSQRTFARMDICPKVTNLSYNILEWLVPENIGQASIRASTHSGK